MAKREPRYCFKKTRLGWEIHERVPEGKTKWKRVLDVPNEVVARRIVKVLNDEFEDGRHLRKF